MIKIINFSAWIIAVVLIALISMRDGGSEDSRTQVIHVDGQSGTTAARLETAPVDGLLDSISSIGGPPQTGPDDESMRTSGNDLAVIYNDSGAVALSKGMPPQALAYLKQALVLDSTYARAYYNMGIAYQTLNRLDDAVLSYSESIRNRPNYFEPTYNIGCLYADIEEYDQAIKWLTKATDIVRGDRSAPAHLNLGNVYRKTGDTKMAEASYREALRVRPGFVEPRFNLGLLLKNQKRFAEAVNEFKKVGALGYRPAKLYRNIGICFSNLDSLNSSAAAYEQWAILDSLDGSAWYNLAIAKARQGDTTRAISAYTKALGLDSTHYQAAFNLALLYSKLNYIGSARIYYLKATKINPSYSKAFYNLALTYSKTNQYDSAVIYYSRVVELDPENFRARFNLALAHNKSGDIELAAEVYRTIVDKEPTNKRALNNLGTASLELKQYDSALWYFNRLVNLAGEPESYFNRAKSYHRLDSLERAKEDYRQAIKLKPGYGAAYHNLAILEEKSGNPEQAVALLEQAVELGNQGWKRYWKLGQLYVKLGQIEKARLAYAAAAKLKPKSAKFRQEYKSVFKDQ